MAVLFVSVVGAILLDLYVLQDLLLQLTADITLSETVKASTVAESKRVTAGDDDALLCPAA